MSNLKGKNLVFLFQKKFQHVRYEYNIGYTYIAEAYEELSPKGHLEVVFVSTTNRYDKEEEDFFFKSKVPWTAIPFSDFNARKQLRNKLSPSGHDVIFDTNGNIFLDLAVAHHFELYGAELFPFTNEHLSRLREYFKAGNAITLHSLFKDAPLMSPDLEEVFLSKLNGKIVGVYMFAMDNFKLKDRLLEIYYHCKLEFEVVLVDFHSHKLYYENNLSFTEGIKGLPWFSFPFRDFRCRRIWQLLNSSRSFSKENILTIFDKKGRMVETFGYPIVEKFGANAFPFTQERVIEIEKQRLEEVTLETLFKDGLTGATVIRHTRQCLCKVVSLREYMRRKKSLFFLCADIDGYNWIKGDIAKWYCTSMRSWLKKRETNPGAYPYWNFEVIFVFDGDCKEGYDALIAKMPWAAIPFEKAKDIVHRLKKSMLYVDGWSFITFTTEGGGKLISVDAFKNLDYYGSDDAPVSDDGRFLEEVKALRNVYLF